jgi:type I restriction-modification system DNA methylase subunit
MAVATPQELLKSAYDQLGYAEGPLYEGASEPNNLSKKDWIEKGEWLTLAKKVGAEKIFFVENNPVVIFAQSAENDPEKLRELFNKIWCMSRPRLLFLAYPGELAIYDLAKEPARDAKGWKNIRPLDFAISVNEVAGKLKAFRREQLETGRLFEEEYRFGDIANRADKALINNLKEVRMELINKGLKGDNIKYAHSLIGRSIFIRYLEDRKILIPEDFYDVASNNTKWKNILKNNAPRPGINLSKGDPLYARVLSDKDFTFALFKKLARDFNGDMFPDVEEEEKIIELPHLELIQDLLFGDVGRGKKLFFYAYRFEIVPIELISSIYEEFYHPEIDKERDNKPTRKSSEGAYYTPPALVEFLVNQVLTPERLSTKPRPRVLDPSCGSGIFLVEAFRRIVRHRMLELGKKPNFQNLQKILRKQIAGIEINPEAARIAAFSLYLAMLHYLDPPSIREQIYKRGNRLPYLIYQEKKRKDKSDKKKKYYNILLAKNAFDSDYIENNPVLAKSFSSNCAEIVIGNPPWGSPGKRKEDKGAREDNKAAIAWCDKRNLPIGDQERSQAFIWRALDLLNKNGCAGLLVSTGIFFKYSETSVEFRKKWIENSRLTSIFNFAHTRTVFFNGAISPFAAIFFEKTLQNDHTIQYWTSKKTRIVENLHSVVFTKNDCKPLQPNIDLSDYKVWKIYLWGNQKDDQLIRYLETNRSLISLSKRNYYGDGYKKGNEKNNADWLSNYQTLPHKPFDRYVTRYGRIDFNRIHLCNPPSKIETRGKKDIYQGPRLIFKEVIDQSSTPKGMVIARYEDIKFSFTDSIFALKLRDENIDDYKYILGICWSSLARYYWFLTGSNWGVWRDKLLYGQVFRLPIKVSCNVILKSKILKIVEELQTRSPEEGDLFQIINSQNILTKRRIVDLEKELDQAVFELYQLSNAEIDLIRDMCEKTLPYYYSPDKSMASKPVLTKRLSKPYGTIASLPKDTDISEYLEVFIQSWIPYLDEGTEFGWQVYQSEQIDSMIAVVFSVQGKGNTYNVNIASEIKSWDDVLMQLENNLREPFNGSRIYLEGIVRGVSKDKRFVLIIKRSEKRLWTRSMAREDAEATLNQAMDRDKVREEII